MRGSLDGAVEPDRYRQETLDMAVTDVYIYIYILSRDISILLAPSADRAIKRRD